MTTDTRILTWLERLQATEREQIKVLGRIAVAAESLVALLAERQRQEHDEQTAAAVETYRLLKRKLTAASERFATYERAALSDHYRPTEQQRQWHLEAEQDAIAASDALDAFVAAHPWIEDYERLATPAAVLAEDDDAD